MKVIASIFFPVSKYQVSFASMIRDVPRTRFVGSGARVQASYLPALTFLFLMVCLLCITML